MGLEERRIYGQINKPVGQRINGAKGFLRRMVVYLKDHNPYPDSSLFIVNLRIQLELIC